MNEPQVKPLDLHRKPMKVGDIVIRTRIIDHAGHLYTSTMRGQVVDIRSPSLVVISTTSTTPWSVIPWPACDWIVVAYQALS